MSDNVYIGRRCAAVSKPLPLNPISKVILWIDNSNCFEAGDNTGREIEITCPYGTQEMANDLLRKLVGYTYNPVAADDALLDPAAELGDAVTVDGCYTVMASMDLTFDGLLAGNISAPGSSELPQEFSFSENEKILSRKIARNRSLLTKTAEEIRAEVSSLVDGEYVSASITAALGEIELEASSEDGTTIFKLTGAGTEIKTQTLDITVKAAKINGKLTASQIETDDLKVKAANITGTLTIGQLPEGLASTDDIPTKLNDLAGAADDITTIVKGTVTTAYLNAKQITAAYVSADGITTGTLDASFLALDGLLELKNGTARGYVGANNAKGGAVLASANTNVYVIANDTTAKMSSFENHMIWVHTSGCFATDTLQISSDRTMKDNINYDLTVEEEIFAGLRPCSFSYISDKSRKKHWGFIAQDFIATAQGLGMDTDKLAVLGEYEGKYSIGYGEITALNTHMIQRLMRRVAAMESKLEG